MNVLFILPSLKAGGAEKFICNLAVSLANDTKNTIGVFIMGGVRDSSGASLLKKLKASDVSICGGKKRRTFSRANFSKFEQFASRFKPDVVVSTVIQADFLAIAYRLYALNTSANTKFFRRIANRPSGLISRIFSFISPLFFHRFIFCNSALTPKGKLSQALFRLVGCKYETIINGVSAKEMRDFEKIAVRRTAVLGPHAHKNKFFCVGRMEGRKLTTMQKGFDLVVGAVHLLKQNKKKSSLCIYGNGPLRGKLEELIRTRDLEDCIHICPTEPISDILRRHSTLVFPSRHEGLSNVVVESLLSGCHVCLSDIEENQFFRQFYGRVSFFKNNSLDISIILSQCSDVSGVSTAASEAASYPMKQIQKKFSMERCSQEYESAFRAR